MPSIEYSNFSYNYNKHTKTDRTIFYFLCTFCSGKWRQITNHIGNPNKAPPFTTWDNSEPLQLLFPFLSAGFPRLINNIRLKLCRTRADDPFAPSLKP